MSREEFRQIRVDGCEIVGRGAHGIVYKIAPDEVVKVYREDVPLERIKAEKNRARRALILGVPTAISFDIVKVGNLYGAVYELLDMNCWMPSQRRNTSTAAGIILKASSR